MHGAVHDFIVLKTVKDGELLPSAEEQFGGPIKNYASYPHDKLKDQPVFKRILDIGSLDINGSMRSYDFIGRDKKWTGMVGCEEYLGLDLVPGSSVDIVANAHNIPLGDDSFDLVLCSSVLEHDSFPQATVEEAHRVLKNGQPFILATVNQDWGEHKHLGGGDTETYNHITKEEFTNWIIAAGFARNNQVEIIEWNQNLFCYAIK